MPASEVRRAPPGMDDAGDTGSGKPPTVGGGTEVGGDGGVEDGAGIDAADDADFTAKTSCGHGISLARCREAPGRARIFARLGGWSALPLPLPSHIIFVRISHRPFAPFPWVAHGKGWESWDEEERCARGQRAASDAIPAGDRIQDCPQNIALQTERTDGRFLRFTREAVG